MSKLNVKNGTPVGNEHLCRSCDWGQFVTGYRESDMLVICTNTSPNVVVPFVVHECTEYCDKRKPNWEQMQKLAIEIQPVRVSSKTAGFAFSEKVRPISSTGPEDDEHEEDEVARLSRLI